MNAVIPYTPNLIAGAKGGKGGGGSGSGGTEAPNSLRSKQIARLVDLLGEGPIVGPVNAYMSVYFDGVPLASSPGVFNFQNWTVEGNHGWPDQPVLNGFAAQQAETQVGLQLKTTTPLTRTIINEDVDRVRLTVSVPTLQVIDKKTGNINGTTVEFDIYFQSDGGGYRWIGRGNISGKTNTRYQRSYMINVAGWPTPMDIRLVRVTPDSTTQDVQNDLYWDSYTEIIDSRVNYTLSAVVGITIDAEQFQSIPKRTYEVKGLYVLTPTNYDPVNRIYYGVWDGTFKMDYTNNPAWVFMDMIVNSRYGIGDFVSLSQVDKWALYRISQWCDGWVPDGRGGYEPRFVCNAVIRDQQEAFDLLNSLASVFRGQCYWAGGLMVPVADMPSDPVAQYTNANVVNGNFTYSGADVRARHNMAQVKWNDPENLGEPRIAIVEDHTAISKYGIQKTDVIAVGCTSESQAIRVGKWTLYSDTYEGETVTFSPGLDAAWCRPGDIIQIADVNIGGKRRGGRCGAGSTTTHIIFDAPVGEFTSMNIYLSCVIGDGKVETKQLSRIGPDNSADLLGSLAFSAAPLPDTVYVISEVGTLETTLWSVKTAREGDDDRYEVTAIRHRPDKWNYVENNIALSNPDVSDIGGVPPINNLNATDYLIALSSISVGVRMLISWQSSAPSFDVAWRPINGNWNRVRIEQTAHDVEALEGTYEIWVTPVNSLGRRGKTSKINYTVVGRTAPPGDPRNFRIQVVQGVAMFQWAPTTELDVIIGGSYEMRYSPRMTGVTWTSSNTVLTSIPGTATTVELPYRPGTYLLRTRDILGLFSRNAAIIVTSGPDTSYRPYYRICEQPVWLGNKVNVEVREPQNWLVLGVTGGLWDDQPDEMDDWPDVDNLPIGPSGPAPGVGTYVFFNHIDMGGVFAVRLTVDMLAFPYIESDIFVDERAGNVDDWQDWDNASEDGTGMVTIRVRQTDDDPTSPTARWTNWTQFLSGEYTGRGFQFRADLDAPPGQNVAIEELCIIADISAKSDHGADVPWVPAKMHITYTVKFFLIPSISIAIQEGMTGDTFRITNKTREGFDLELLNAGAVITGARTFDWIAQGY